MEVGRLCLAENVAESVAPWERTHPGVLSETAMLRQLCGTSLCLFGLNTTHQLPAPRVFRHVNAAFVPFEAEATNLPFP